MPGVGFFFSGSGEQGVGGVGVFGEVDPALGGVDGAMAAAGFDAGGEGEAGYGVAHPLALAAAETANGVAHQHDLAEVIGAERGAAKFIAGAELALDGDAVVGVQSEIRGFAGGMGSFSALATGLELVLEFHFQCWGFSGRSGRSKSFSAARRGADGLRCARMGWTAARAAAGLERRACRSWRSF